VKFFCGKSLKKELSIDTTFDPCYFSWDSPFKILSIQNSQKFKGTMSRDFCMLVFCQEDGSLWTMKDLRQIGHLWYYQSKISQSFKAQCHKIFDCWFFAKRMDFDFCRIFMEIFEYEIVSQLRYTAESINRKLF